MSFETGIRGDKPIFEALEPRLLLSGVNYVVNSLADDGGGEGLFPDHDSLDGRSVPGP